MARKPETDPLSALAENVAKRFAAKAAYKDVLDQRGNALVSVNETGGPRSKSYTAIEERLKKDEQELERIKISVRRPVSRLRVRAFVLLLVGVGLALLEAPANKFLFDVALQSTGFVSYSVSVAVTAFLLLMAHFAGRSIRQIWSDYRHKVIWSSPLVFLFCITSAGVIIGILTVARAAYASQGGTIGDLMAGIQGNVQSLGPIGALVAALSDTSALVLACINVGGIVATMMLAFFSHDPDRDYDHVQTSVDHGQKALEKVHAAYLKDRQKTVRHYAPDLLGYAANYNSASSRVIELKTLLKMVLDDDDRLVLTDLDQMAEDIERDMKSGDSQVPGGFIQEDERREPTIASMSEYRKQAGTEGI
jgi:hypothetical protein